MEFPCVQKGAKAKWSNINLTGSLVANLMMSVIFSLCDSDILGATRKYTRTGFINDPKVCGSKSTPSQSVVGSFGEELHLKSLPMELAAPYMAADAQWSMDV